jgi:hypothetical protein
MSKSLDEIYRQMQQQQAERRRSEMLAEQKRAQISEQQRREWVERNRLYESSLNPSAASSVVGSAGGRNGYSAVQSKFLAFDIESSSLYSIDNDGNLTNVAQIFNGITVLSDCFDDPNFVYFVTYDTDLSKVIFGKFDKVNYQRIDIDDTNLNNEIDLTPNSLYYAGEQSFIYSADSFGSFPDTQGIYSISIDGQSINQLSTFDNDSTLMNIFEYNGQYYSVLLDYLISSLNLIDLNTGLTELVDLFSMNVDTLPENISSNTKVVFVFDVQVKNDEIWASVVLSDKDNGITPHAFIGKINIEEQLIDYVIALPSIPVDEEEGITFTNFVVL